MEPVRLKLCGISLTRKGYLTLQLVMLAFLAVLIVVLARIAARNPDAGTRPLALLASLVVKNLYWVVPLGLVLDGIEVVMVLRRFAQKEALQRKRQPGVTGSAGSGP